MWPADSVPLQKLGILAQRECQTCNMKIIYEGHRRRDEEEESEYQCPHLSKVDTVYNETLS